MEYFYLVGGLIILLYSGNFLVKGGVSLARHYNISTLVVGVTIISFGTSAPELLVSVQAAVAGHPDIAIGNVIGSNIANIALVLGLTTIILPIPVRKNSIVIDWPIMMFAGILLYILLMDNWLSLWEGLIFVVFLTAFLVWSIHKSRLQNLILKEVPPKPSMSIPVSVLVVLASSVGLAVGSNWLVKGAAEIAETLGVSERIISITIIAFGTSVPELATSLIAAVKKETDISIGNIIGSNIFNIFGILGITSVIKSIPVNFFAFRLDIAWMLSIFLLLFAFILPAKGGRLRRWEGVILFLVYLVYIYWLFK